ncbi:hypothetical protein F5887DRAFT_891718, partial [Amanita rubescens]
TWHIVHAKDNVELTNPTELEEVVICLQGVLWKHDLPPFTEKVQANSNRVKFLRQSVTLTGFGTETFEKGIKALNEVHALFDRHIPENKLGECTIIDKCDEHLGIHLTNRYFTSRRESPTEPHIPFASDVDPMGFLANLVGGTYFQSEQNTVKYYNRSQLMDTIPTRYEEISPVRFRIGDIVEAKATLMLIPLRGGHFKLSAVLQSVTIMDTTCTQVRYIFTSTIYEDYETNA